METLDRPMTAGIEKIEANSVQVQKLSAEVEELLNTPPVSPRVIPWGWLVAGAVAGASVVAISALFLG